MMAGNGVQYWVMVGDGCKGKKLSTVDNLLAVSGQAFLLRSHSV